MSYVSKKLDSQKCFTYECVFYRQNTDRSELNSTKITAPWKNADVSKKATKIST